MREQSRHALHLQIMAITLNCSVSGTPLEGSIILWFDFQSPIRKHKISDKQQWNFETTGFCADPDNHLFISLFASQVYFHFISAVVDLICTVPSSVTYVDTA